MPDRSVRTFAASASRSTGLLMAAALALIFAGIILFVAVGNRSAPSGPAIPGTVVDIGKAPDTSNATSDPNQIQATSAARMQFADKADTTRLSSELAFDRLDPVGPGYYTLTQPRAWLYMKDGRILYIRADNGRVRMPNRNQMPESGEFRGSVLVRLFAPPEADATGHVRPIDPEKDIPAILAATDSVAFDSVLLELNTPDPVEVSAKNLLFQGEGLRVRANQVKERIELLKTNGKFVRFNPTIKTERRVAAIQPTAAPASPAAAPATKPPTDVAAVEPKPTISLAPASPALAVAPPAPPANKEQMYKAIFADGVTVSQTTRRMTADTLEIFTRLINNQLPDNAFGTWPIAPSAATSTTEPPAVAAATTPTATSPPATTPTSAPPPATETQPVAAAPVIKKNPNSLFVSAGSEDIVMTWTGPLVLTPIVDQAAPPELQNGVHLAARFSADKPGGQASVDLLDSSNDAHGECARVEYSATTRTLSLLSGPDAPLVRFEAPGSGLLTAPSAKIDLGTGIANIPGGGQLLALRSGAIAIGSQLPPADANTPIPADQLRRISWTDQADFRFRTEKGKLTGALDWAQFKGTVLAQDRTSSIGGDTLTTDFAPVGRQPSAVKRLKVEGNVLAIAGQRAFDPNRPQPAIDPYITCDKLVVDFNPSKVAPDDMDPSLAVASGKVKAADKTSALRAARLEIAMGREEKKPTELVVIDVLAAGDVQIDRADGVSTRSDTLRASPLLRTAQLLGKTVTLTRGPSTITATQVDLDDAASSMIVYGVGSFEHIQTEPTQLVDASGNSPLASHSPASSRITASWTKGMMFNNIAGTLECSGDSVAVAAAPLETQTLRSEKLRLWLTPADQVETRSSLTNTVGTGPMIISDSRRLLRAEAIGASEDREGAANATIEVRRYAPPAENAGERILDQLFYIEGPRILADDVKGTITMPAPGRAIIRDQRAANTQTQLSTSTGLPMASSGAKGTSKFTWAGSMEFARAAGTISMKKDVELIHLPLGTSNVTRLVAQQMDATFNLPADTKPAPGASRSAELVRAVATGAVYAESGQQRLIADTFAYNAQAGTAEASAAGGNRVTLYDDRKGSQLVARKLFWDLVKDRVEIMEPAPVTTPR